MSQVLRERAIGMLTAGMSTRAVAREFNVPFSTISRLQRRFREFGSTSNRPHNHWPLITTPAQNLHIQHLHLQDHLRPGTRTYAATISLKKDSLWVSPIVWVSGLLMSTLWIEWPMVTVGLWYGQAYVMDNEHRCILLMAFWMHRDTVTRYWGPLLCHSSTTITSCCSMKMHGPMLQGSVHNSWKLKTSQFLHGQHTHRTCHPLSMFGMLWIGVYDSVFQFLPISSNFTQPLKRSGPTFHRPLSTAWSTLCEGDVLHWQMVVTPDTDWISDPPIQ